MLGVSLFRVCFSLVCVGAQVLCGSGFCVFGAVFGVLGCVGGRFFVFWRLSGVLFCGGGCFWGGFFYLVDVVLLAFVFFGCGFFVWVGSAFFVLCWSGCFCERVAGCVCFSCMFPCFCV